MNLKYIALPPPNHLDGVSPLLLRLGVCSPPPVFVGFLVGLLVVITVLIIYAQSWGQGEVTLGPSGAQQAHLSLMGRKNPVPEDGRWAKNLISWMR